jgi:integrase
VLALVSKMLNLAETWGLRPLHSNPCPRIARFRESKRERFMSGAELRRLGEALSAVEQDGSEDPAAVLAIRLLLLTGARRDEILNLRWEDVDLDTGTLNLPDSKTGKKSIPLGPAPAELLAAAPRLEGSPYVIPGRRPKGASWAYSAPGRASASGPAWGMSDSTTFATDSPAWA